MEIFKFGGASIKDANSIINVSEIIKKLQSKKMVVVISAIGKTTNELENVVNDYFKKPDSFNETLKQIEIKHLQVISDLFKENHDATTQKAKELFIELRKWFKQNKSTNYNFVYDQSISFGELLSTTIISNYLNHVGVKNQWIDARECIKTDNYYRDGNVDWQKTEASILHTCSKNQLYITQGFIGSDDNNFTTTLGREGSDYTASIFGYILNATSVTIWKDVQGVLNADPKLFKKTTLLKELSYRETIELSFYGASVIHPKTLQPLQRKKIPLFVKSFVNPEELGTKVSEGKKINPLTTCFIVKKEKQVLLKISTLDFSFIVEKNIKEIFELLDKYKMRVDVIQNSAISFAVCVFNKYDLLQPLIEEFKVRFKVDVYEGVTLYTLRHFSEKDIREIYNSNSEVLLEQKTMDTAQLIVK